MAYILLFLELVQGNSSTPPPVSAPDGSLIRESNQAKNKLLQTKRNYSFQTQNRLMRYMQIFLKMTTLFSEIFLFLSIAILFKFPTSKITEFTFFLYSTRFEQHCLLQALVYLGRRENKTNQAELHNTILDSGTGYSRELTH